LTIYQTSLGSLSHIFHPPTDKDILMAKAEVQETKTKPNCPNIFFKPLFVKQLIKASHKLCIVIG
jgi:hypothetical protein